MKKSWQKIFDLAWKFNIIWESQFFMNDCTLYFLLVSWIERRKTSDEFIKQGSKSIEVNTIWMSTFLNHLWWHILSTSTKTICDFPSIKSKLRQTKISYLDVSIMIDEQIFWFKISIYDILLMKVHKSIENFNKIELSIFFRHSFHCFKVVEELSSRTICIEQKVQSRTKQTKLWVSKQWFSFTINGWFSISIMLFSFSMIFSFWF